MIERRIDDDATQEEWEAYRARVRERVEFSIGHPREGFEPGEPKWEEVERFEKYDLTHVRIRYQVIDDEWNNGILVLPPDGEPAKPAPAILAIHGTNGTRGKLGSLDLENTPRRAYGIELAQRGHVCLAVDQYGFGESVPDVDIRSYGPPFQERYPDWSLDGRRFLEHSRALDVLERLPYVDGKALGAMGNSLGGRAVVYLAALDERVAAAVSSTGISPNVSNVFRSITRDMNLSPRLSEAIMKTGRPPWDYQDLLSLIAPRALLALEPFNDNCNPDVGPTLRCLYLAASAWVRSGAADKLAFYTHGDGHDTIDDVREMAYRWLDRFLK